MTRYVGSKWTKTVAIRKNTSLNRYVPATARMTSNKLLDYVKRYKMVYIKPEYGMHGNGVMRVESTSTGYRYQLGKKTRSFTSFQPMYHSILQQTGKKRYLVQKGIHLLKYGGSTFDLRVLVQFSPKKTWESTGIIGRVAAKNKIVTNYHSGGKVISATRLLRGHTTKAAAKLRSLSTIGVKAGKAMQAAFPGVYVIGLDIAMDKSLHPWILEVNTSPALFIYRKHADPKVYRKIMRYAKNYSK